MAQPPAPLERLLDSADPAWPQLQAWFAAASNSVLALPGQQSTGEQALFRLQVSVQSALGAMALHSGGVLVDGGWLRLYGQGCAQMQSSLLNVNGLAKPPRFPGIPGAIVVGSDVMGGIFAINAGGLGGPEGLCHYFSPDTSEWVPLGHGYTGLLQFACEGDLAGFFNEARWDGWDEAVETVSADEGIVRFPPPWRARSDAQVKQQVLPFDQAFQRLRGPKTAG